MLTVRDLHVGYGRASVLEGVSFDLGLAPLAIVGRNGMGKTTLCMALMGMVEASRGEIRFDGAEMRGLGPRRIARRGIALVPQGRRVFASLTVDEHLRLFHPNPGARWTVDRVYATFPRLAQRRGNRGSRLSGGEQQMLAIARALLMNPRLVVMDEPSEGLAPVIVEHFVAVLNGLAADGIGLLLIEQNLRVAAAVAEDVAVMVTGRIEAVLPSARLLEDKLLQQTYLGISARPQSSASSSPSTGAVP